MRAWWADAIGRLEESVLIGRLTVAFGIVLDVAALVVVLLPTGGLSKWLEVALVGVGSSLIWWGRRNLEEIEDDRARELRGSDQ